ncbi:hypothetical protein KIH23_13345 [Flavobacterium sp. CYK-55]|uniref:hypothetical protein n=1 Tax=Flavobacterium sp. CYK-55 TaxID=2835529 RepID=UPI001BCC68AC|nr:hypothetical protein [Flavobacterium sp. CYK-55]MBS7788287.1 hypothetical protein [Flavobacterium sp. CYK-55]
MKRRLLYLLFLFIQVGYAQVQEIPFTIGSASKECTLIVDKQPDLYKFTLQNKEADIKKTFEMKILSLDNFIHLFNGNINSIDASIAANTATMKAIELYSIIVNNNEKGPIAGNINISKKINIYDSNTDQKVGELTVNDVKCVVEQGFIQDINVVGKASKLKLNWNKFNKSKLSFTNIYGIGFTSKKNYVDLSRNKLFLNINFGNSKPNSLAYHVQNSKSVKVHNYYLYITLGEVIKFERNPNLSTNDFSPADIAASWKGGEVVTLYKESTFKLFEGRVFTDLAGFNSDNPNGLIQVEVEKKLNFNTIRRTLLGCPFFKSGIGYFEYIKPYGGYSKFETSNKYLTPNIDGYKDVLVSTTHTNIDNTTSSDTYIYKKEITGKSTTPVDLLKHQIWRLGLDINCLTIDMPLLKSQLFIDGGVSYCSSAVQDSLKAFVNDRYTNISNSTDPPKTIADLNEANNLKTISGNTYNINYWQFYPKFTWRYASESRFGVDLSYSPKYFYLTSDELDIIGIKKQSDGTKTPREDISKWMSEFEFLGFWRIDTNGKLFIRWRLNFEAGYSSNYYNQIQVGYAFNLLGNK